MDPNQYVAGLELEEPDAFIRKWRPEFRGAGGATADDPGSEAPQAAVDVGAVISFEGKIEVEERMDVLNSIQLAQRAASAPYNRFFETQLWYGKFVEVMEKVGWVGTGMGFVEHRQGSGHLEMDSHALSLLEGLASGSALILLKQAVGALKGAAEKNGKPITLFERHATAQKSGNFQVGAVEKVDGVLALAMGALYFESTDNRKSAIFARWGANELRFWSAAQRMELNSEQFGKVRDLVKTRLGDPSDFVAGLDLAD